MTVLFADVKGSMDLAEGVGPEEWHRILDGFFRILSEGIHRFEGTVNQYTGDGVMALFGAPFAHEDHAQRACYAALRIRAAVDEYADELRRQGHSFAVRIGLNSGEVVVGTIGDDLRMDYTAQGHVVGLAARIQTLAAPGRACLSGETARLVEGYFQLRDLGTTQVKGVKDPVALFELEEVGALRTRLERSRARGFTAFVGRVDELQMLESTLDRADAGQRQIVGVVGEAGIGKSRLCAEFVESATARGIPIYTAHCPPHGKSLSGVGRRELSQSFLGVSEHDTPAEARRKIAGTLVLLNPSFQEMLPLVFEDCGVPDPERPAPRLEPEVRQQQTAAFLREITRARSERECALFLLDDLHWADPETDLFISQLAEAAAGTRTVLLCNFRPEYEADWMDSSDYLRIPLRALTAADSALLVDRLLGTDSSLAALRARILERAGGNPFFAEELVQGLLEAEVLQGDRGAYSLRSDAGEVAIPETVHSVLAARIDRLGEREKEVLQAAAVVGREFGGLVLAKVLDCEESELGEALAVLRSSEFITEEAVYPETEYAFKHPLTHEVAYRTQLRTKRASLHRATAAALAERNADVALIAQHLEEAGETLAAAQRFAESAGDFAHLDPEPASRTWRKVRALCRQLDGPEARALHEHSISRILLAGWGSEIEIEEAAEIQREGMELARASGNVRAQVILLGSYSFLLLRLESAEAQLETLEQALPLVADTEDLELFAMVHQRLGWACLTAGNLDRCLEVSEAGLARCGPDRAKAGRLNGYGSQLFLSAQSAYARGLQGHFAEAEKGLLETSRLALEDGDSLVSCSLSSYQANLAYLCGDLGKAEAAARRGVEYAETLGPTYGQLPLVTLGLVLRSQKRGEELLQVADAFAAFQRIVSFAEGVAVHSRASGLFHCGRVEEALVYLERNSGEEGFFEESGAAEDLFESISWLETRSLILGARAVPHCEKMAERIQPLIDTSDMKIFQPELDLARAELARLAGDDDTRRSLLEAARRAFVADGRSLRVAQVDRLV